MAFSFRDLSSPALNQADCPLVSLDAVQDIPYGHPEVNSLFSVAHISLLTVLPFTFHSPFPSPPLLLPLAAGITAMCQHDQRVIILLQYRTSPPMSS